MTEAEKRRANRARVARMRADNRVVKPGFTGPELEALEKLRPGLGSTNKGRTEYAGGWHSSQNPKIGRGEQ